MVENALFHFGISAEDVVFAEERDGQLVFIRSRSGRHPRIDQGK
jgi:hypothetical protein